MCLAARPGNPELGQGDFVAFTPPLIITREQIDEVMGVLEDALSQVAAELESEQ